MTEYSTGISGGSNPTGITSGPDGSLWFTERTGAGRIGRITTGGVVTEFPGAPAMTAGQPTAITTGPDGNLWFTESANPGAIGKMSTTGVLTEFTGGALTHDGAPTDIVAGDDGNLYFTENHAPGELGRITPAGVITEFTTNLTNPPLGITVGGDGNVWFTEATGNQVGRLTIGTWRIDERPVGHRPDRRDARRERHPERSGDVVFLRLGCDECVRIDDEHGIRGQRNLGHARWRRHRRSEPSDDIPLPRGRHECRRDNHRCRSDVHDPSAATNRAHGCRKRRLTDNGDAERRREPQRRCNDVSLRPRRDERVRRVVAGRRRNRRLR